MAWLVEDVARLPEWLQQPVLAAIFAVSLLMWTLIFERYLFLIWRHPRDVRRRLAQWSGSSYREPIARRLQRQSELAAAQRALNRHLGVLQALVAVLPLLGLFGTVNGMAATFEAISAGSRPGAGIGGGISQALISTLAGLVCALPGLYASANLRRRAESALAVLARHLEH